MLLVGSLLILSGLLFALFQAHVQRLKAWDRPGFTRTRAYATLRRGAPWTLLLGGLVCLSLVSMRALLTASAVLAGLGLWLLRVRSAGHALNRLRRDRAALTRRFPGASEADLRTRVLRAWHPEWPEEIVERAVADHEVLEDLVRMVVRMERKL